MVVNLKIRCCKVRAKYHYSDLTPMHTNELKQPQRLVSEAVIKLGFLKLSNNKHFWDFQIKQFLLTQVRVHEAQ